MIPKKSVEILDAVPQDAAQTEHARALIGLMPAAEGGNGDAKVGGRVLLGKEGWQHLKLQSGMAAHSSARQDSSFLRQDCRAPLNGWGSEESGLPDPIILNLMHIVNCPAWKGRSAPERYVGEYVGGSDLNVFAGP